MKEIKGNLIELALQGKFDVIAHGCNCFCTQKSGLAPQMVKYFGTDKFPLEQVLYKGDINKLGHIDYQGTVFHGYPFFVVNAYTQYAYGKGLHLDYEALTLCLRKINHIFKGKRVGLPKIGAGLAGGDWDKIKEIIEEELIDCQITIVHYEL